MNESSFSSPSQFKLCCICIVSQAGLQLLPSLTTVIDLRELQQTQPTKKKKQTRTHPFDLQHSSSNEQPYSLETRP